MFNEKKKKFTIAGKEIEVSTGKLARQATAAVQIKCGNTILLVTVTKSEKAKKELDYFPLMVDFEEKIYSVGRIPGSYNRREGRASDKAVLTSRLIDRPIRPLFPDAYRYEVQVNVMTLSVDQLCPPDTLAMLGVGFALELSGLPVAGEVGAVRVSLDADANFIVNPSEEEILSSPLDIVVAGTEDSVMMVEAGANFVEDDKVVDAIAYAHARIQEQVVVIREFAKEVGVTKEEFINPEPNSKLIEILEAHAKKDLIESMQNANKESRRAWVAKAQEKVDAALDALAEDDELHEYLLDNPHELSAQLKKLEKKLLRKQITETGVRADARKNTEIRPLDIEVGSYPGVHGDGLFTRGNTQVLALLVLGTEKLARSLDGIDSETQKFYMHNYNFPGWSVGEAKPNRGPGRREIGHGALAERAVQPSLPKREDFPYAMRVVSEVLESSGSTSMAATCASSLALMDAGVPVTTPVAGIAMGLIKEESNTVVLTDIHELEDFLGDMDFKVAGNDKGISALQMDIKIKGISLEIIRTAIKQAREGRLHILSAMTAVIAAPRKILRANAPRIVSFKIDPDKIGAVIGSGGKNIKWITEVTGTEINITDNGTVCVYCVSEEAANLAKKYVTVNAEGAKQGEIWEGEVVKVLDGVGVIVELIPGVSGLVHISQIALERVDDVHEFFKVGDKTKVLVQGLDFKGRMSLSIKALLENPQRAEEPVV
ncbi:MAG: polyribonucleotide nucleotidyltransferase [Cyanobacteria bacterium REEB446]|nr:polyribonucleotide nucleotidyltransferase [Cyanobacteria bacterium REEB446]